MPMWRNSVPPDRPALAAARKTCSKWERLALVDDIEDTVGAHTPDAICKRGEIRGRVQSRSVALGERERRHFLGT
jgi:hypothetical protein